MRLSSAALALAIACLPSVYSIFSDEAYQIDFQFALLGVPQPHATFFHRPQIASPAALLYAASEKGVIGAVNPKDGAGVWRQTLHTNLTEKSRTFMVPGDGAVITASTSGVAAWDALDGRLVWDAGDINESRPKGLAKTPSSEAPSSYDFVALYSNSDSVVYKLDGATGKLLWKYSDPTGYDAFAIASTDSTTYYIATAPAMLKGSKIKVMSIDNKSGQESKQYTLSVDVDYFKDGAVLGIGGGHSQPFLFWADPSSKSIKLNGLGSSKVLTQTFGKKSGEEITDLKLYTTDSSHFLAHIITPSESWAEVYGVDGAFTAVSKAYDLPMGSNKVVYTATTGPSGETYFAKVSQSDVTLFSSDSNKVLANWSRKQDETDIAHSVAEVVRGPSSFAVRVSTTSNFGEWSLIRNGEQVWSRPEMLANVETAAWASVESTGALAQELEIERHKSLITAYVHRVRRHIRDLPKLGSWLQSIPQTVLENLLDGSGPDKSGLAAQKTVIMASETGIFALDFSKGVLLWSTLLPQYDRTKLRRKSIFIDDQKASLLMDGATIFTFELNNGQEIAARDCPPFSSITQIPGMAGFEGLFVSQHGQPDKLPGFSGDGEFLISKGGDQQVLGWSLAEESKLLWNFQAGRGSKIIGAVSRPNHDPVASIGKVLGNRSVLYKYLSPNLALITSTSEDTLTVTLLDAITGTILYTTTHTSVDTSTPIPSVISENWFAYSFFSNPDHSSSPSSSAAKGHHLIITELYESPFANDRGPLGNSANYSAFSTPSLPPPHTISQAFIIPQPISLLSVTQTSQGITSRSLLAYLPATNAIVGIPRAVLDPRRPIDRDPTSAEAEEGLFRYAPFLDFDPKWYLTHSREVLGIRQMLAAPTMLESTGLVFAFGHDVFGTRVSPSMAFDVLGKGFNRVSLLATVVALAAGVGVLAPMVRRRQVDMRWKGF